MNTFALVAVLLACCAIVGYFSPARQTFDYLLTAVMPISFFCSMFIIGLLEKSDLETQFHLSIALRTAFQPIALQLYFLMAIMAFAASFKRIRHKNIF